jgi:hydrogenase-4 component F
MILALLLTPLIGGGLAFAMRPNWPRRALLVLAAVAHGSLVLACWRQTPQPLVDGWLAVDSVSLLFLSTMTVVFLVTCVYAVGYLAREGQHASAHGSDDVPFVNYPEATFTGCLLLFLAAMTLVLVSRHWGLMWVAVEATTLASAPLIYFHRSPRSLEATWKYLVICSVGIAIALLGNFFLAVAARGVGSERIHLVVGQLEAHATELDPLWLKAAFMLLLVGYGTKMGLAPLHTWLPDAHSEAPSMVSALLSGVLLNCAFLAVLRAHSLLAKAGLEAFSRDLLTLFGLISMGLAALFIIGQADYKRLLAYSSVEHMGILALGIGIGGAAGVGSLLHMVNHSLTKAMLFLAAGNTLAFFHSKSTSQTRGILGAIPVTGVIWLVGLLAITGSPPFGTFISELAVLKGIVDTHRMLVAAFYLGALSIAFVGMATVVLPMIYGTPMKATDDPAPGDHPGQGLPKADAEARGVEAWWSVVPPLLLGTAALVLGLYLPKELTALLQDAATALGAK